MTIIILAILVITYIIAAVVNYKWFKIAFSECGILGKPRSYDKVMIPFFTFMPICNLAAMLDNSTSNPYQVEFDHRLKRVVKFKKAKKYLLKYTELSKNWLINKYKEELFYPDFLDILRHLMEEHEEVSILITDYETAGSLKISQSKGIDVYYFSSSLGNFRICKEKLLKTLKVKEIPQTLYIKVL